MYHENCKMKEMDTFTECCPCCGDEQDFTMTLQELINRKGVVKCKNTGEDMHICSMCVSMKCKDCHIETNNKFSFPRETAYVIDNKLVYYWERDVYVGEAHYVFGLSEEHPQDENADFLYEVDRWHDEQIYALLSDAGFWNDSDEELIKDFDLSDDEFYYD